MITFLHQDTYCLNSSPKEFQWQRINWSKMSDEVVSFQWKIGVHHTRHSLLCIAIQVEPFIILLVEQRHYPASAERSTSKQTVKTSYLGWALSIPHNMVEALLVGRKDRGIQVLLCMYLLKVGKNKAHIHSSQAHIIATCRAVVSDFNISFPICDDH